MWSKTRQVLESRLADDLKGRVCYHYDVYRGKKHPVKRDWFRSACDIHSRGWLALVLHQSGVLDREVQVL